MNDQWRILIPGAKMSPPSLQRRQANYTCVRWCGSGAYSLVRLDWLNLRVDQRGPYDEIRNKHNAIAFRDVQILAECVRDLWPAGTSAQCGAASQLDQERQWLQALIIRMQADPDHPLSKETLWRGLAKK